ncbi:sigma-70 family RNA polymerase sigma factor [Capsulimonas corticalis]|nr:sigma-70 family RNA polymerase sigma factor [Capsulimonas corticalis]
MTDRDAFQEMAERYRGALHLHCYRMLGSLHDAEDCVQETYVRAWSAFGSYAGMGSPRNWLYKIATNTCLNALARRDRSRRVLPEAIGPASRGLPEGEPSGEIPWLEPYPDLLLARVPDTAPGPHARYEMREAVEFAFVAAIQYLPARQRAALLLCDVLGWSAAETAALLEGSVASVNSALQRARATLAKAMPGARPVAPDSTQSRLLDRYMQAWESKDVAGFAALLKENAVLSMPPWIQWYVGRNAIREFFDWAWNSENYGGFQLTPTSANASPAFALYSRTYEENAPWRSHSIQMLTLEDDAIAKIILFVKPLGPTLFPAFGLRDHAPFASEERERVS